MQIRQSVDAALPHHGMPHRLTHPGQDVLVLVVPMAAPGALFDQEPRAAVIVEIQHCVPQVGHHVARRVDQVGAMDVQSRDHMLAVRGERLVQPRPVGGGDVDHDTGRADGQSFVEGLLVVDPTPTMKWTECPWWMASLMIAPLDPVAAWASPSIRYTT